MWLPPGYEVMLNWLHGLSTAYWVSLLQIAYLSVLWIWQL